MTIAVLDFSSRQAVGNARSATSVRLALDRADRSLAIV
jgi:hypothetical protein